ncbi:MAG: DUF4198 domain-containing protein [Gemmatimonadaceae bacterium]
MKRNLFITAAAASVFAVSVLSAHDTWLLPSSLRTPVSKKVILSLTSGEAFPVDDFAIDPKRVTRANVRLAGKTTSLAAPVSGKVSLHFAWTPNATGIAAIAIELAPKTLTLTPDKIEEYFADINASTSLRATWDSVPKPKQWRESYTKHAATFVLVGEPANDSSWRQPLGMGFEIIPDVNPTTIKVGEVLRVHAVRAGKPVASLEVGFQYENDKHVSFATTNAAGTAQMKMNRAGRWLVNATSLRRTHAKGLEWESDFATMTIAVGR